MNKDIRAYNAALSKDERKICNLLMKQIYTTLVGADSKIWHRNPVWFLDGNPIVGYSKVKKGVRLMFWSGMGFGEPALQPGSGKFKDASILYTDAHEIKLADVKRWLKKSKITQWDYKNIVKRKGKLVKINL